MIPKIIHYSWISNDEKPELIRRCMDTWNEHLSDYQFINWNLDSFNFNSSRWLSEAYEAKNWAACSDYLRVINVHKIGGIWLDTDVEVIKSFNDLLHLPYFIGKEPYFYDSKFRDRNPEAAVFGFEPGNKFLGLVLEWFDTHSYKEVCENNEYMTLPVLMKKIINEKYTCRIINDQNEFDYSDEVLNTFDFYFFSPVCKNYDGSTVFDLTSEETYCIHRFAGSWIIGFMNQNNMNWEQTKKIFH